MRYAAFVTAAYQVENSEGRLENMKIEIGDFCVFPLQYLEGAAPASEGEISLSVLQAQELEKTTGDIVTVMMDGTGRQLTVSGNYQDVTNGGKTAKALLPWSAEDVLWFVVNMDVAQTGSIAEKIAAYESEFPSVRVMDMEEYLQQTLGGTVRQLQIAAGLALATAVFVAMCITSLFFRMLLAKDAREVAIMASLGFTRRDIGLQYSPCSLLVLIVGVLLGTLAVGTLGKGLVSSLGRMLGASSIQFVVHPFLAYFVYPLVMLLAVGSTALICSRNTGISANPAHIAE